MPTRVIAPSICALIFCHVRIRIHCTISSWSGYCYLPPSTPLPSPRSCSRCALCQKNRKESRLRDENELKLKASFTFLPPKTRVSGNWKMFISRCSTFEGHLDRGVLHMVYHICKLYNLPRTAAKADCPWHQV